MGLLKNYSRRGIVEIRSYLIELVNTLCDKYEKKWTDRNESDLGMFFVELAAGISDMLNYQVDMSIREVYLPTARQRKNVKKILALTNYRMKGPTAAVTNVTFSVDEPTDTVIVIPKYTQLACRTSAGRVYFATTEECDIIKGKTSASVTVMQGIVNVIHVISGDLKVASTFEILSNKVAHGSVRLVVGDDEWTEVEDILVDENYGTKFSVRENEDDHPCIEFGPTYMEFLPVDNSTPVTIYYIDTDGENGVVQAGAINEIEDTIVIDDINYTSLLSVTNAEASTGGAPRETIGRAKVKGPDEAAEGNSMCTLEDYETEARKVQGVYQASAVDWNTTWDGVEGYFVDVPYKVRVFVMPEDKDSYIATEAFLKTVYDHMATKLWCSNRLYVESAVIYPVDIVGTIYTREKESIHHKLKHDAENAIKEFLDKENCTFGNGFTIGSLEHVINSSNIKIDYCELSSPSETIRLSPVEFPRLGKLELEVVRQTTLREVGMDDLTSKDTNG